MKEYTSSRVEGLIWAAMLFVCIVFGVFSLSGYSQLANVREFLEKDLKQRAEAAGEAAARRIEQSYPLSVQDPTELSAIKLRYSLHSAALLDRNREIILDQTGATSGKANVGIAPVQFADAWSGKPQVSPIYMRQGGWLRSAYHPVKDQGGTTIAVFETTFSAGYIEDLTQLKIASFFFKAMGGVFLLIVGLYAVRLFGRPREHKDSAGHEAGDNVAFMVGTFQSLVATLKEKERELKELKEKAEVRARSAESYNENVLKNIQSGVMSFDREGLAVMANAAALSILGLEERPEGKAYPEIFGGGSWICGLIERTLADGTPQRRGEGEYTLSDGGVRWLGAGTSPLAAEDGSPAGAILVFTDITEVKELREQVELKERLTVLGEMSAGIAHELRNPMGVILGYAEMLKKKVESDPEADDAAKNIISEIRCMDDIIREFMNFSRPAKLNISHVDVNALLEEALEGVQADGVDKEFTRDDAVPAISGDAVLLRQTFLNLLNNAVEAMPDGGKLAVTTTRVKGRPGTQTSPPVGSYVKVRVEDTGVGMDEKQASKIFMPFFTTKPKGTGLGLAIVQKIIVYHGGKVAVRSRKGKGTVFTVYLPEGKDGGV